MDDEFVRAAIPVGLAGVLLALTALGKVLYLFFNRWLDHREFYRLLDHRESGKDGTSDDPETRGLAS